MRTNILVRQNGVSAVFVIILAFLLVIVGFSSYLTIKHILNTYTPRISTAQKMLDKGKYDKALDIAKRAANNEQKRADAYIIQGKILLAKTWKDLKKENWRNYAKNSEDWLESKDIDEAIASFKAALQIDPNKSEALYFLGTIYKEKGWFRQAEDEYLAALQIDSMNNDSRLGLASMYTRLDRFDEAEELLRDAYKLDSNSFSSAKGLAFLFRFHTQQPESSMVWFNRYLNKAPEKDYDINIAIDEMKELMQRYPEVILPEKPLWKDKVGKQDLMRR